MKKEISSIKIFNLILCVVLLITFVIGSRTLVKAEVINNEYNEMYSENLVK